MKKIFYLIFATLLGLVSCTINNNGPEVPGQEDGKVTVLMKVTLPEVLVVSKSSDMASTPLIDNLYVATFGTDHYLNDYVKAIPCNADWTPRTDYLVTDNVFYFKVTLTATTSKRYVHVFANGPASLDYNNTEDEIMKSLTTKNPAGSYWTYLVLNNGTAVIDEHGNADVNEDTERQFANLKLIRNFARVTLDAKNVSNFTLTGYQVFNGPKEGAIVAWSSKAAGSVDPSNSGYFKEYGNYFDIETLLKNYSPFITDNTEIDTTAPASTDRFTDPEDKYIYERPDSTSNRPYIIMQGRFQGDSQDTFYKLEFVDPDGNHLPILRNYEYEVHLSAVPKSGASTPDIAQVSNANVSSMTTTANLTDLADGTSRIYVQWLDKTYLSAGTQSFQYMYLPDARVSTSKKATLQILEGAGEAIDGETEDDAFLSHTGPDSNGWWTVTFKTTAAGDEEKVTKFRVTGQTNTTPPQKLYRDITVHVLPKQDWDSDISVTSTGANVGQTVTVTMTLPDNLPSSIFPIEIKFEDSNHVLNPNDTSMPALIGSSIAGSTSTSFQFVKSINYLGDDGYVNNKEVTCVFKRVKTGGSTLYFQNEYFDPEIGSVSIPAGAQN